MFFFWIFSFFLIYFSVRIFFSPKKESPLFCPLSRLYLDLTDRNLWKTTPYTTVHTIEAAAIAYTEIMNYKWNRPMDCWNSESLMDVHRGYGSEKPTRCCNCVNFPWKFNHIKDWQIMQRLLLFIDKIDTYNYWHTLFLLVIHRK